MPAYLNMPPLEGESTEANHKKWVIIQTMTSGISRSLPKGARDHQRTKGETTLSDVGVTRELDKSSPKLQEAAANGTFFEEVVIDFCGTVNNKQETYLQYKLSDCIVTSYNVHATQSGDPLPTEQFSLNYTKAEWVYFTIDPKTGMPKGKTPGKYSPGAGKS